MRVLIFYAHFVRNIFHSKKNLARCGQKCILVFMQSTRYSCQILMKFEFSGRIFEKYSNFECHEHPFSGSRVVTCGRTDMKKLIVVFNYFTNAPMSIW